MAWRLARSLDVLRDEVRGLHPGTRVDTIGDADHADEPSDHNPNAAGVVCAADFFANAGLDLADFAEHLRRTNHRAVKYVIYNRRIWSKARAGEGWRTYTGDDPHTSHVHVSVGVGPDGRSTGPYDNTSPWGLLEDDVELSDRVNLWDEAGDKPWRAGKSIGVTRQDPSVSVGQLLQWGGEVGHLTHGRVLPALARIEATLAVIAGQEPVAAVRAELAKLTDSLVAAVRDAVPASEQDTVEAALRDVLGPPSAEE
jgi:hypothetical protein